LKQYNIIIFIRWACSHKYFKHPKANNSNLAKLEDYTPST